MLARDRIHVRNEGNLLYAVEQAAYDVGVKLSDFDYDRNSRSEVLRFRILPADKRPDGTRPYQRTSGSGFHRGRKVHAVCWHGHRDFMRALFERRPNLVLSSSFIRYNGRDDFEANHDETRYHEAGSPMYPAQFGDLCECDE